MTFTPETTSHSRDTVPEPLQGILRPIEWALLCDSVRLIPARVLAIRAGITIQGLYRRLRIIRQRLTAAGLDGGSVGVLIRGAPTARRVFSGLTRRDRLEAAGRIEAEALRPAEATARSRRTLHELGQARRGQRGW